MKLFIAFVGILVTIFFWGMIFYYMRMIFKYRNLANIERKKLEKLNIYTEEYPLL
jgi:hypothetical protein